MTQQLARVNIAERFAAEFFLQTIDRNYAIRLRWIFYRRGHASE
jgi:hypothetical protein